MWRGTAMGLGLWACVAWANPPSPPKAAACPHPYFPIDEALRFTYRSGKSELAVRFESVDRTANGVKGRLAARVKDKPATSDAECDATGIRLGFGGIEGTLLGASGMDVTILTAEGVVVPSASALVPGKPWTSVLSVELRPPAGTQLPLGMKPVLKTTFTREAEVVGEEEITVGAGKYTALKIRNRTTASGGKAGAERTLESYLWLAKGVGIVKIATGEHVDLELVDFKREKAGKK